MFQLLETGGDDARLEGCQMVDWVSRRRYLRVVAIILGTCFGSIVYADGPGESAGTVSPVIAAMRQKYLALENTAQTVIPGQEGWLYFAPELRALSVGVFWGRDAQQVSRSSNPQFVDPLPAIVDFQQQLKRSQITLLLVPVPAKVAIYPEWLLQSPPASDLKFPDRIDTHHQNFYRLLKEQGVEVLDLSDEFRKRKQKQSEPLYCRTDTHWSGKGIEVAAEYVANRIRKENWYRQPLPPEWKIVPLKAKITGDLTTLQPATKKMPEEISLVQIRDIHGDEQPSLTEDVSSPVLLLGDSHTLVFHENSLYATGCGLSDHLAYQLKSKIDLIGVRGSGGNAARISWRRRANPLGGKKCVVWCFTMREFTENTDGWRQIPITKVNK